MPKPFSLSKHERLKSKKDIDTLFLSGKAFFVFPFKVIYHLVPDQSKGSPVKFGISVPKRAFKKAVDRNRIKRKVREAYRTQKIELQEAMLRRQQHLDFMLLYTHQQDLPFSELQIILAELLLKLKNRCITV